MGSITNLADKMQLSGDCISNGFGYIESIKDIDFSIIFNLITKGEHNGKVLYIIRNCIPDEWTQQLTNNFNKVISERGSHRNDDGFVLVQQIGSSQFSKNGTMYIQESNQAFNDIDRLFSDIPADITDKFFLGKFLEKNFLNQKMHFGASRYKHGYACMATFRRWLDNGVMSLMPHEDKAQLAFAAKDDYEIAAVPIVIAQNLCLEATGEGGDLTIWNIQPDNDCRKRFGVEDTGYPYPPEYLNDVDKVEVRLNPGDVYFMNASCLHGVKSVINGNRLTAGRFIGALPDNKVVYWT